MTEVDPDNEATFHVCVIKSDPCETAIPKQAILQELRQRHDSLLAIDEFIIAMVLRLEQKKVAYG